MPFIFIQKSGHFLDAAGKLIGTGVAGHGPGLNNPAMQNIRGVGPLPVGRYTIGDAYDDPHLGPVVMRLTPDPANQMFTRAGFFIHGFSATHYALSSDGCICLQRPSRESIADDDEVLLDVVAFDADVAAKVV